MDVQVCFNPRPRTEGDSPFISPLLIITCKAIPANPPSEKIQTACRNRIQFHKMCLINILRRPRTPRGFSRHLGFAIFGPKGGARHGNFLSGAPWAVTTVARAEGDRAASCEQGSDLAAGTNAVQVYSGLESMSA